MSNKFKEHFLVFLEKQEIPYAYLSVSSFNSNAVIS